MTDYSAIIETETDPGAPSKSSLWKRYWKNPLAMFEGAVGAPRLQGAAHPTFAAGTLDLLNVYGTGVVFSASFTASGSASGTSYDEEFRFCALNAGGLRASVDMNKGTGVASAMRVVRNGTVLSTVTNTTATYGVQTIDFTFAQGDVIQLQCGVQYSTPSGGGTQSAQFRNLKLQADQRGVFRA
jgi:hypothetical protein